MTQNYVAIVNKLLEANKFPDWDSIAKRLFPPTRPLVQIDLIDGAVPLSEIGTCYFSSRRVFINSLYVSTPFYGTHPNLNLIVEHMFLRGNVVVPLGLG
jgi:hypothetical protein